MSSTTLCGKRLLASRAVHAADQLTYLASGVLDEEESAEIVDMIAGWGIGDDEVQMIGDRLGCLETDFLALALSRERVARGC